MAQISSLLQIQLQTTKYKTTMGKALIIKGANFSQVAVDTIDILVQQPVISISLTGQVSISSPDGYDIYYTTDGSTPTNASTKYTGSFGVQQNTTVKAVCYNGSNYSEVASQLYDGTLQAPTISITNKGVVTITATDNAAIRYTTDGSTPTSSSGTVYSGAFSVANEVTVKAIAYVTSGGTTVSSAVSSATAQVVEGIQTDKSLGNGERVVDYPGYFVSPKIPITAGTSYTWTYIGGYYASGASEGQNCTLKEGNSSTNENEYWNLSQAGTNVTGSITKTAKTGTTWLRFCFPGGSAHYGTKVTINGETVWEYNAETDDLEWSGNL